MDEVGVRVEIYLPAGDVKRRPFDGLEWRLTGLIIQNKKRSWEMKTEK
jgi:hypothetical protein